MGDLQLESCDDNLFHSPRLKNVGAAGKVVAGVAVVVAVDAGAAVVFVAGSYIGILEHYFDLL